MTDVIALHGGRILTVHDPSACAGQACCVHNPSEHPLKDRPLHWRSDRQLMERICVHGVGHPDPDDLAHWERKGAGNWRGVHGCDGCCSGRRFG